VTRTRSGCVRRSRGRQRGAAAAAAGLRHRHDRLVTIREARLVRLAAAQQPVRVEPVVERLADRARVEHEAHSASFEGRIAPRLVVPLAAAEAQVVEGRRRPAVQLQEAQAKPPAIQGEARELAMKRLARPAEGARPARPPGSMELKEQVEVGVQPAGVLADPEAQRVVAREAALRCPDLAAEVPAPPSQEGLPAPPAGVEDGTRDLTQDDARRPLVRGDVVGDEHVRALGLQHRRDLRLGNVARVRRADRAEDVACAASHEAKDPEAATPRDIQRQQRDRLARIVAAVDQQRLVTRAEVPPPRRDPLVGGERPPGTLGQAIPRLSGDRAVQDLSAQCANARRG
jgi:hypothetical protein